MLIIEELVIEWIGILISVIVSLTKNVVNRSAALSTEIISIRASSPTRGCSSDGISVN